jgi:tetratricopeptide (TPR) repeat protein
MRRLTAAIIAILLGIAVLGGGGWWVYNKLSTGVQQSAVVTTEKIRAHLLQTAEETHRRELAETEAIKDWKERQRQREAADNAHAARLSRIEELAASFAQIEGRGTATSVFQEMTRILAEQGVDEAIAYGESLVIRKKLADGDSTNTGWQINMSVSFERIGRVAMAQGKLEEAADAYGESLAIFKKLAEGDPTNTGWQRDLAYNYWRLAYLSERRNDDGEAKGYWKQAFDVLSGIEKRGLHLSPEDRKYLEILRQKAGTVPR